MRAHCICLLALAAGLGVEGTAAAAQSPDRSLPQLAQELFLAETVYLQQKGEVQLTLQSRLRNTIHLRLLGEYGLSDRLQSSLAVSTRDLQAEGERSIELGFMYAVLPFQSPVALSIGLDLDFGADPAPQWEPAVIAAKQWGRVQLHGSLSGELSGAGNALSGAAAILVDMGRLSPTLEWVRSTEKEQLLAPGVFLHLREGAEVGLGVVLCRSCESAARGVHAMFTVEF